MHAEPRDCCQILLPSWQTTTVTRRQAWSIGPDDDYPWTALDDLPCPRKVGGWSTNGSRARLSSMVLAEGAGGDRTGDEIAAGTGGRGHLRASHADREQVIGTLKAAFVQGRLTRDELDLRVGQALAPRTYAELAALTADLPAGLQREQQRRRTEPDGIPHRTWRA